MIKVGLRLPTLLSQGADGAQLVKLAQRAEASGFDSAWCVDHLLAAEYVFGSPSYEPLTLLAHVAAATRQIQLGVSVLISPLRQQFWLMKHLGTLSALAGERVLLGLGAGWSDSEFAAAGEDKHRRGARLDDDLDALLRARESGELELPEGPVAPAPSRFAALLLGGGGSATVREGGQPVRMQPRVARRVARGDGWIIRSSAPTALWSSDLAEIRDRRAAAGATAPYQVVRATFIHIASADGSEAAVDEQLASMAGIGWRGDSDLFRSLYPAGGPDDIVAWLSREAALGVTHFILHPVGDLEEQVDRLAAQILPALRQVVPAS